MKIGLLLIAILAIAALVLTGCAVPGAPSSTHTQEGSPPAPAEGTPAPGTESPAAPTSQSPSSVTPTGTLEVRVTDAPPRYGEIKEIWVTVDTEEGIMIHKAVAEQEQGQQGEGDGEWLSIPIVDDETFELLALKDAGVDALLGWAEVPVGKYTQIRMAIHKARVVFEGDSGETDEDDVEVTAELPSGKLKFVRPFNVVNGGTTIIMLDFIADKSVHVTGNDSKKDEDEYYDVIFKPVIKLTVLGDVMPGADEAIELEADEAATAEWSKEQAHSGKYSAYLDSGNEDVGDEARIIYHLPEGTTLGDIDSISWWEYLVQGYPPHVDILLDTDGDGDADDALVFEYAYNTEEHYADAPMPYGALTGAWYRTFSDDGEGPPQVDNDANGWFASGPPGPPGDADFIYYTLEEWKAGVDVDGDASIDIDGTTLVPTLEIEVDNWVVQSEAYVDDIVVNYTE